MKLDYIKFNNINLNNNTDRHMKFAQNFHQKDLFLFIDTVNKI